MNTESCPARQGASMDVTLRRLLSTVSLCKRAGKLLLGNDPVREGTQAGKVKLVLTASDLSERSRKGIGELCRTGAISCRPLPFTMDELWFEIGKRTGILAITDPGLAAKLADQLDRMAENKEESH